MEERIREEMWMDIEIVGKGGVLDMRIGIVIGEGMLIGRRIDVGVIDIGMKMLVKG